MTGWLVLVAAWLLMLGWVFWFARPGWRSLPVPPGPLTVPPRRRAPLPNAGPYRAPSERACGKCKGTGRLSGEELLRAMDRELAEAGAESPDPSVWFVRLRDEAR